MKSLLRASVLAALTLATCAAGANAQRPPSITAPSAILVEPSSGTIVYARAPYKRRAIASTTKMMTALLLLERRPLSHRIRAVNYSGSAGESTAGIEAGEKLTAADMLRALLLPSANEAAAAIAVDVGGSRRGFVRMMNARAKRAGLRGTHFANPVGLDSAGNYSTARDLAQLGILLRRNKFARETMNLSKATLYSGAHRRVVFNHNRLISSVSSMNGIKTGHTQTAGYLLVGGASRAKVQLISVVMAEPSESARDADTLSLMRYGFSRYSSVRAVRKGQIYATAKVAGRSDNVNLVASQSADVVMRAGQRPTVVVSGVPDEIEGPKPRGSRVGFLSIRRRGKPVTRVALLTSKEVQAPALLATLTSGPLAPALVLLAIAGIAFAATLSRKRRRRRRTVQFQGEPT